MDRARRPAPALVKIDSLRREQSGSQARVSATLRWEDRERAELELSFEAEGDAAGDLQPDPNAFLLACALPAMRHGERRIAIEGPVCPRLRDGLVAAAGILRSWYGAPRKLPSIEPRDGFRSAAADARARAGAFLSGGLDSLDLFLQNREWFPQGHPSRLRDAIHVTGLPYTGPEGSTGYVSLSERARAAAAGVAHDLGVSFIPVRTNLGEIDVDFSFYRLEYFGSAYAAVAHLFSSRFSSVAYASAQQLGVRLDPLGSHPLLDPLYSTSDLEFRHEGADRTRIAKAETAARYPHLLRHLHVCLVTPLAGTLPNCGRCQKCLHTLVELALAGVLDDASSFPAGSLSAAAISTMAVNADTAFFWWPLPDRLRRVGRSDLADAIETKIAEMRRIAAWHEERGWKGRLRRWDRRLLQGRLLAARRRMLRAPAGVTERPARRRS